MSTGPDTSGTAVYADFAGRPVKFELRLGEIGEYERRCEAGIGEILLRLASHRFRQADIHEAIRLGLIGGGEGPAGAEALMRYNVVGRPLAENLGLAARIVEACVTGVPTPGKPVGSTASEPGSQEISPSTMRPEA